MLVLGIRSRRLEPWAAEKLKKVPSSLDPKTTLLAGKVTGNCENWCTQTQHPVFSPKTWKSGGGFGKTGVPKVRQIRTNSPGVGHMISDRPAAGEGWLGEGGEGSQPGSPAPGKGCRPRLARPCQSCQSLPLVIHSIPSEDTTLSFGGRIRQIYGEGLCSDMAVGGRQPEFRGVTLLRHSHSPDRA
eukprot:gene11430-biopygen18392